MDSLSSHSNNSSTDTVAMLMAKTWIFQCGTVASVSKVGTGRPWVKSHTQPLHETWTGPSRVRGEPVQMYWGLQVWGVWAGAASGRTTLPAQVRPFLMSTNFLSAAWTRGEKRGRKVQGWWWYSLSRQSPGRPEEGLCLICSLEPLSICSCLHIGQILPVPFLPYQLAAAISQSSMGVGGGRNHHPTTPPRQL